MAEYQSPQSQQIVFLGDGSVGKTSLIQRFLFDRFDQVHRSTVEDIYHRRYLVNDIYPLKVEIIDTSGTYVFPEMRRLRISKATGFVLVLSLTEINSLHRLHDIITQIRDLRSIPVKTGENGHDSVNRFPPLLIAANKLDCWLEREISDVDLSEWLEKEGLHSDQLVLTSAKEDDGVWTIFASLWQQHSATLKNSIDSNNIPDRPPVHTTSNTSILERLRRFSAYAVLAQGVDTTTSLLSGSKDSSPGDNGLISSTDHAACQSKIKKSLPRRSVGPLASHQGSASQHSPEHVFHVDCNIS